MNPARELKKLARALRAQDDVPFVEQKRQYVWNKLTVGGLSFTDLMLALSASKPFQELAKSTLEAVYEAITTKFFPDEELSPSDIIDVNKLYKDIVGKYPPKEGDDPQGKYLDELEKALGESLALPVNKQKLERADKALDLMNRLPDWFEDNLEEIIKGFELEDAQKVLEEIKK